MVASLGDLGEATLVMPFPKVTLNRGPYPSVPQGSSSSAHPKDTSGGRPKRENHIEDDEWNSITERPFLSKGKLPMDIFYF